MTLRRMSCDTSRKQKNAWCVVYVCASKGPLARPWMESDQCASVCEAASATGTAARPCRSGFVTAGQIRKPG